MFDNYVNVIGNNVKSWDFKLCEHCDRQNIPVIVSNPSVIKLLLYWIEFIWKRKI